MEYIVAVKLGLGFSALALGIFISLRIFNIPDITTDGSFTLGGAVTAVLQTSGNHSLVTIPFVFLAGCLAGMTTGFIHTKLKVNSLLSGILVSTALYSVNLAMMQRSTIPVDENVLEALTFAGHSSELLMILFISVLLVSLTGYLLKTDFGLAMRATGNNEQMIRSMGVNTSAMKIKGLALANGLTALSGFLIVNIQGYADIGMGTGIVILGLGSVLIGEITGSLFKMNGIFKSLAAVIAGAIIFRIILAFALSLGIDALYLKLMVAVFVLLIVGIPNLRKA